MNRIIEIPKYRVGGGIKGNAVKHSISSNGLNHVDLSYYIPAQGVRNLVPQQIVTRGLQLQYRDKFTNAPFETRRLSGDTYNENYFYQLTDLWLRPANELIIAITKEKNYALISRSDSRTLKFMEIICKGLPLESVKPNVDNMIWDGYSANLWDYFKPQFDDSSSLIEGVYINPNGYWALRPGKDILKLDADAIIDFMMIGGIICKKSSLAYQFNQDFVGRKIIYKTLE